MIYLALLDNFTDAPSFLVIANKKKTEDDLTLAAIDDEPRSKDGKEDERASNKHEALPPKEVAMHRVRWNMNKGCESFQRLQTPRVVSLSNLPDGVQNQGPFTRDNLTITPHSLVKAQSSAPKQVVTNARRFLLLNSIGST